MRMSLETPLKGGALREKGTEEARICSSCKTKKGSEHNLMFLPKVVQRIGDSGSLAYCPIGLALGFTKVYKTEAQQLRLRCSYWLYVRMRAHFAATHS